MKQVLKFIYIGVPTILLAATAGMWARSHWYNDYFADWDSSSQIMILSSRGSFAGLLVHRSVKLASRSRQWRFTIPDVLPFGMPPLTLGFAYVGGRTVGTNGTVTDTWMLVIPYWAICAIEATPLMVIFLRHRRRRRKLARIGVCPKCGYDLRATPERCPECGTLAAVQPTQETTAAGV